MKKIIFVLLLAVIINACSEFDSCMDQCVTNEGCQDVFTETVCQATNIFDEGNNTKTLEVDKKCFDICRELK